jgi:dipeptidyl aminopeptidase/acylaminoacyl peptidase
MTRPFEAGDLLRYRTIPETDASPAEELVAAAVTSLNEDKQAEFCNLWLVPLDGAPPWQMTQGDSTDTQPRWSPDGLQLGFISDRAGTSQVFVIPRHGGEARQLTRLPGPVASFEWSPSGERLLVTCALAVDANLRGARPAPGAPPTPPDAPQVAWKLPYKNDGMGFVLNQQVHLFVVDADSGAHTQLTDGPFDVRSGNWSPDGRRIVYARTREGDEAHHTELWITEADGANARRVTHEQTQVMYPVWSPDGRHVVFCGNIEEGDAQARLWRVDVDAGRTEGLGDDAIEIGTLGASLQFARDDPSRLWAVIARRGVQEVVTVAMADGRVETVVGGDRQVAGLCLTRGHLAYSSESPVSAMELYACAPDGAGERRLSGFNAWFGERTAATLERRRLEVPDGEGGSETIDGWLVRPAGAQGPGPLLLDVHGGPASYVQFSHAPVFYWALLWSRGWSILAPNAVGSTSYGRAFADRLNARWGELDLPQHLAAIDGLQAQGIADERIAIAGKSYGGFLASWAIGQTQRFRAAAVLAPVGNIETHFGTSDSGFYADPYSMGGDRRVHRETMRRLSPTQYAERATTPTLLLQGEADERCPKCQAEELFVSMKRGANPPCELVIYPGASHKFTSAGKPPHRVDAADRIRAWLERWVERPPQPS